MWACQDANVLDPDARYATAITPRCGGLDATIYRGRPGATTNAAGGLNIIGTAGIDIIVGSAFSDTISALGEADIICGGAGDDFITGGPDADRILGGAGIDVADYSTSPEGVRATTRRGRGSDAEGDVLTTIEGLNGSAFNDVLTGDSQANWLSGNGGADRLVGAGGADALLGGEGLDNANYALAPARVTADLSGTGRAGDATGDTYSEIENLVGSAFADTLIGDGLANRIDGGADSDVIWGRAGNDRLTGGTGNDRLYGEEGADKLYGESGTNTIDGGDGTDSSTATCLDNVTSIENLSQEECPASGRTSLMSADSTLIRADLIGSTIITVRLKDTEGNNLTQGGYDVVLTTTHGTLTNGTDTATAMTAVDLFDGTYTLTLVGGDEAANAKVWASVNGDSIYSTVSVIMSKGRSRTWTAGAGNTDWMAPGNWNPASIPTYADSVTFPAGLSHYPVLTQNTDVKNVTIADGITIAIGAFNLTSSGSFLAPLAPAGGVTATSGTLILTGNAESLRGSVPALRIVSGSYTLLGNLNIAGRFRSDGGKLVNSRWRIRNE